MKAVASLSALLACTHAVACSSAVSPLPPRLAFVSPAPTPRRKTATSPLMSSLSSEPDVGKFPNLIYATDDTVQLLRDELKSRLLKAADEFKTMKAQESAIARKAEVVDGGAVHGQKKEIGYVPRLLSKIVRKMARTKTNTATNEKNLTESPGILSSAAFRQIKLEVGAAGEQVIELAEQLSLLNPTSVPTLGFKEYGGAPSSESKLAGNWKLRFTTAADASFSESEKRGAVTTSQVIDAEKGTLTNVVDFEKGKLKGFRVIVEGEPASDQDIDLAFKAVKILRKSRFPRLFGRVTFRLPSRLIRRLASRNKGEGERNKGPSLKLRYLDSELRCTRAIVATGSYKLDWTRLVFAGFHE